MANLKEIRGRIKGVKSTQKVTKAMKMVSAAKLKKAQNRMLALRPYAAKMKEIIENVTAVVNVSDIPSKLVQQREVNNVLMLVVTSNRGLCGPFNSNLIKHTEQFIHKNLASHKENGTLHFVCVGKKGYEYFSKRKYNVIGKQADFDILNNLTFERADEIANHVFEGFETGKYDQVYLCYNEFRNVMAQNRKVDIFLPVTVEKGEEDESTKGPKADYIFEPDREQILTDLIPKSLKTQFFRAVLESNAAEQGARMVAMDSATENAEELLKQLKLSYNKARQASITKEILEIAAGADALEG
jgi:F-type H+-transporting ATPase subunit gamma